jgi:hypothetical protein
MHGLEEPDELYWKPLSWLGTIRPTSAHDAVDPALWTTFVSTTLGLEVPVLSSLPRRNNSPLAQCGCKKHGLDLYGDHNARTYARARALSLSLSLNNSQSRTPKQPHLCLGESSSEVVLHHPSSSARRFLGCTRAPSCQLRAAGKTQRC